MYQNALRKAESDLDRFLCNQITDVEDIYYGGIRSTDTWDVNFHDTAALYVWAVRLYLLKDSRYYGNEMLYERIRMAYLYLNAWKHEDGTKDYIDCDFHTAAGSEVQNLAKTVHIIDKFGSGEKKDLLRNEAVTLMESLAGGIVAGGFHTPNHRWIFSGSLAVANSITPHQEYLEKAEQYLNEGIDGNEDGEYAERSAGIYSYITNEGLILAARYLNRPDIYEFVRRNLYMMRYFMEPDGTIFTMNSLRQDFGLKVWAEKYLSQYLYMGDILSDELLKKTADRLYFDAVDRGREIPVSLEFLLLNPQFIDYQPVREAQTEENILEASFRNSGIMRRTGKKFSITLLENSKTFFFAQFGDINIFLRMSAHFFHVRNIIPEEIIVIEGGYRLLFHAEGNFLLPLKEKQETTDWWKMDHSKREILHRTDLTVEIDFLMEVDGVTCKLRTRTCDNVPFRVEIGISPNCMVRGEGFLCKAQAGMWLIPQKGLVTAESERSGIEIGPVFGEHGRVTGREGSASQSNEHMTIYMNQFCTANERVFHIKRIKQEGLS